MRLLPDDSLAIITIWQEAHGESYPGKVAVGEVILNRTAEKYSSDGTIADTILRPHQFSGWLGGGGWKTEPGKRDYRVRSCMIDDTDPVVADCVRAWAEARVNVKGAAPVANGALLYVNLAVARPGWLARVEKVAEVGAHTFYRPKKPVP